MIGLNIDGQNAELKPDTKINIKLVNPLFNEESLSPGSYTLPFELAGGEISPINASIFKNLDVIENQEKFGKQEARIFFDGVFYKKGTIRAKTISPSIISTNFVFGLSTISDEIKTKRIRDIIAEDIVLDNSNLPKKIYLKPHTLKPHPISVNGKTYDESTLSDLVNAINANEEHPRASATLVSDGVSSGGLDAPYMVLTSFDSPNDPLAELSASIDGSNYDSSVTNGGYWYSMHVEFGSSPDMSEYYNGLWGTLQGYFTGAYPTDKIRFPVVINVANVPDSHKRLYNGVTLDGVNTVLLQNIPCSINSFNNYNQNGVAAFVRLKYVLDKIAEYFGFAWEGDFYTSSDTSEMLIWNPNNLDQIQQFLGSRKFCFIKRSFNLSSLVPDLSVVEFLRALASRYNLAIYPNEATGKVRILHREPIAKALLFDDITSVCGPAGTTEDLSVMGIKLMSKKESDDQFAKEDQFSIGEPEITYETAISGLRRTQSISTQHGQLTGPAAVHASNDKFEFRIFYYKGVYNNGQIAYPKADINAAAYSETFSTLGFGLDGLYEKYWKRWLKYEMKRKSLPIEIAFSFADLKNFDWELKRRFDRSNYLIRTLDFTLENTRITSCKAVLYTIC